MVFNWLFRFPQHNKYTYLWEIPSKNDLYETAFLIDGTESSFYQTPYFNNTIAQIPWLLRLFSRLEFWVWCRLNGAFAQKCSVYFNSNSLDAKNDVIFTFGFTSFKSNLSKYTGIVLVHLSHYHLNTDKISEFFKSLKNGYILAEGDVSQNGYFKNYFSETINKVYQLPFTFYPGRFKKTKEFNDRISKCFASGPMSVPTDNSYIKYYGKSAALNPMRETLYAHKKDINDVVDAYIYPHDYALTGMRQISSTDKLFTRFAKRNFPAWILTSVLNYKLPYYSFNIVEKYNEYMMFSSPEERTGLPSMKLLEGVLCGSVLIGIDDPMYTKIGFKDGLNYISYTENDLDDLKNKIHYYQNHPDKLSLIATNGYELVTNKFTPEKVYEFFWSDMKKLLTTFNENNPQLKNSFLN